MSYNNGRGESLKVGMEVKTHSSESNNFITKMRFAIVADQAGRFSSQGYRTSYCEEEFRAHKVHNLEIQNVFGGGGVWYSFLQQDVQITVLSLAEVKQV